ncbi:MAG: response regulator, partial [Candidatus Omnitrophica bacterium]|nr:response regulator [Candidatus Omnitrophota bacterium]
VKLGVGRWKAEGNALSFDHQPSTFSQWVKVSELKVGDEIAVPRLGRLDKFFYGKTSSFKNGIKGSRLAMQWNDAPTSDICFVPHNYMGALLVFNKKSVSFKDTDNFLARDTRNSGHTETSTSLSSTSTSDSGIGKLSSLRDQIYNSIASFILEIASSIVSPCEAQPGSAGTCTEYPPSDSGSIMTLNRFIISNSPINKNTTLFLRSQEENSTDLLWDRIVSIEYCGYEHVYDIEVDGTHNFIGNNIFAHNTAVGGHSAVPGAVAPRATNSVLPVKAPTPAIPMSTEEVVTSINELLGLDLTSDELKWVLAKSGFSDYTQLYQAILNNIWLAQTMVRHVICCYIPKGNMVFRKMYNLSTNDIKNLLEKGLSVKDSLGGKEGIPFAPHPYIWDRERQYEPDSCIIIVSSETYNTYMEQGLAGFYVHEGEIRFAKDIPCEDITAILISETMYNQDPDFFSRYKNLRVIKGRPGEELDRAFREALRAYPFVSKQDRIKRASLLWIIAGLSKGGREFLDIFKDIIAVYLAETFSGNLRVTEHFINTLLIEENLRLQLHQPISKMPKGIDAILPHIADLQQDIGSDKLIIDVEPSQELNPFIFKLKAGLEPSQTRRLLKAAAEWEIAIRYGENKLFNITADSVIAGAYQAQLSDGLNVGLSVVSEVDAQGMLKKYETAKHAGTWLLRPCEYDSNSKLMFFETFGENALDTLTIKSKLSQQLLLTLLKVAKGIQELHREGIEHGNLRPAYVLIGSLDTEDITVKLTNYLDSVFLDDVRGLGRLLFFILYGEEIEDMDPAVVEAKIQDGMKADEPIQARLNTMIKNSGAISASDPIGYSVGEFVEELEAVLQVPVEQATGTTAPTGIPTTATKLAKAATPLAVRFVTSEEELVETEMEVVQFFAKRRLVYRNKGYNVALPEEVIAILEGPGVQIDETGEVVNLEAILPEAQLKEIIAKKVRENRALYEEHIRIYQTAWLNLVSCGLFDAILEFYGFQPDQTFEVVPTAYGVVAGPGPGENLNRIFFRLKETIDMEKLRQNFVNNRYRTPEEQLLHEIVAHAITTGLRENTPLAEIVTPEVRQNVKERAMDIITQWFAVYLGLVDSYEKVAMQRMGEGIKEDVDYHFYIDPLLPEQGLRYPGKIDLFFDAITAGEVIGQEGHIVMVVEDNPYDWSMMKEVLFRNGFRVVWTRNGQEALEILERLKGQSKDVRLLVSDLHMPKMDGYTLAGEIAGKVPVIIVSEAPPLDGSKAQKDLLEVGVRAVFEKGETIRHPIENQQQEFIETICQNLLPDLAQPAGTTPVQAVTETKVLDTITFTDKVIPILTYTDAVERLEALLAKAIEEDEDILSVVIDLDRFRKIKETLESSFIGREISHEQKEEIIRNLIKAVLKIIGKTLAASLDRLSINENQILLYNSGVFGLPSDEYCLAVRFKPDGQNVVKTLQESLMIAKDAVSLALSKPLDEEFKEPEILDDTQRKIWLLAKEIREDLTVAFKEEDAEDILNEWIKGLISRSLSVTFSAATFYLPNSLRKELAEKEAGYSNPNLLRLSLNAALNALIAVAKVRRDAVLFSNDVRFLLAPSLSDPESPVLADLNDDLAKLSKLSKAGKVEKFIAQVLSDLKSVHTYRQDFAKAILFVYFHHITDEEGRKQLLKQLAEMKGVTAAEELYKTLIVAQP